MQNTLVALLKHAGIEPAAKYHETLTEAWILNARPEFNSLGSAGDERQSNQRI